MKIIACFLSVTAIMIIIYGIGSLQCSFQDRQTAASNTFTAFASTVWTQTTRADFELGVLYQVDTANSPGDVQLAIQSGQNRYSSGNLASQVLNTGMKGLKTGCVSLDRHCVSQDQSQFTGPGIRLAIYSEQQYTSLDSSGIDIAGLRRITARTICPVACRLFYDGQTSDSGFAER